jgi:hypothetical protein
MTSRPPRQDPVHSEETRQMGQVTTRSLEPWSLAQAIDPIEIDTRTYRRLIGRLPKFARSHRASGNTRNRPNGAPGSTRR